MAKARSWDFRHSSVAHVPASIQDSRLSSSPTRWGQGKPTVPPGKWGPGIKMLWGGAGTLPPAQASPGQLHLGQAVVTQHLHPGDGGQWPVAVGELQHLVLLGVDMEVFRIRADLHLWAGGQ